MMYGSETRARRKDEQDLLDRRTDMRLLRWMMGINTIENIRNKSKSMCGKHKGEHKRNGAEMVRTGRKKDR